MKRAIVTTFIGLFIGLIIAFLVYNFYVNLIPRATDIERTSILVFCLFVIGLVGFLGFQYGEDS
jgi:uncharacterized protein YacL